MLFDTLRTWVEVDLDAIEHNFNTVRSHLPASMKLLVTVKANGYGHGALRIARLLEGGTTLLFVSHNEEQVKELCTKCAWLDHGKLMAFGDTEDVYEQYKAAYGM